MLEIIFIWKLASEIGKQATQKGLKKGRYQVMAVLLWLIPEFTGIIIGDVFFGQSDSFWFTYIIALVFAALGAATAFGIMKLIPGETPSTQPAEPADHKEFRRSGWVPFLVIISTFACLCVVLLFGLIIVM